MPRGNFNEASKGGLGFVEGYVLITRSISKVFQYPVNSSTHEQSDPFPALLWEGIKLTPEWKPLPGDDNTFEIINRMGTLDTVRPGKLDVKDFDNTDVEPEDLGTEVGVEGNSFQLDAGAKFSVGWGIMKESLEKQGFKPAILGRCVTTDFEGTIAHFKTVEGDAYIAKKGKNAGKEVKPTNLICDRIETFGYEVKDKKDQLKKLGVTSTSKKDKGTATATSSATTAAADTGKANGGTSIDIGDIGAAEVGALFGNLSNKFKAEVPTGKTVKRADFNKALTMELLRMKMKPDVQQAYMKFVKSDDMVDLGEATELFKIEGDSITVA